MRELAERVELARRETQPTVVDADAAAASRANGPSELEHELGERDRGRVASGNSSAASALRRGAVGGLVTRALERAHERMRIEIGVREAARFVTPAAPTVRSRRSGS